ncbi:MAG: hypothetical protein IAE80_26400 [Anaerolinea sp.]|nr:hypothetical protein [Anaerolinea sp.]
MATKPQTEQYIAKLLEYSFEGNHPIGFDHRGQLIKLAPLDAPAKHKFATALYSVAASGTEVSPSLTATLALWAYPPLDFLADMLVHAFVSAAERDHIFDISIFGEVMLALWEAISQRGDGRQAFSAITRRLLGLLRQRQVFAHLSDASGQRLQDAYQESAGDPCYVLIDEVCAYLACVYDDPRYGLPEQLRWWNLPQYMIEVMPFAVTLEMASYVAHHAEREAALLLDRYRAAPPVTDRLRVAANWSFHEILKGFIPTFNHLLGDQPAARLPTFDEGKFLVEQVMWQQTELRDGLRLKRDVTALTLLPSDPDSALLAGINANLAVLDGDNNRRFVSNSNYVSSATHTNQLLSHNQYSICILLVRDCPPDANISQF